MGYYLPHLAHPGGEAGVSTQHERGGWVAAGNFHPDFHVEKRESWAAVGIVDVRAVDSSALWTCGRDLAKAQEKEKEDGDDGNESVRDGHCLA